jgi:hypothetical protein
MRKNARRSLIAANNLNFPDERVANSVVEKPNSLSRNTSKKRYDEAIKKTKEDDDDEYEEYEEIDNMVRDDIGLVYVDVEKDSESMRSMKRNRAAFEKKKSSYQKAYKKFARKRIQDNITHVEVPTDIINTSSGDNDNKEIETNENPPPLYPPPLFSKRDMLSTLKRLVVDVSLDPLATVDRIEIVYDESRDGNDAIGNEGYTKNRENREFFLESVNRDKGFTDICLSSDSLISVNFEKANSILEHLGWIPFLHLNKFYDSVVLQEIGMTVYHFTRRNSAFYKSQTLYDPCVSHAMKDMEKGDYDLLEGSTLRCIMHRDLQDLADDRKTREKKSIRIGGSVCYGPVFDLLIFVLVSTGTTKSIWCIPRNRRLVNSSDLIQTDTMSKDDEEEDSKDQ